MRTLVIEWQRLLDEQKQTCPRCGSTEQEVEKAVHELNQMLSFADIAVSLVKKAIDPETFKKDALQSNRILVAEKVLEEWLGATTGQTTCCDACGDAACRTIEYAGDTHEAIPADLIVKAGLIAAAHEFQIKVPQKDLRIPLVMVKNKNV